MITKAPGNPGKVRVTFSMPAAIWADHIYLVGDFNDWNITATPLRLNDTGWSVTLDLDIGKEYQYRYLLNGCDWHNDWQADRYVPNEYGGDNSVVVAELPQQWQMAPYKPAIVELENERADVVAQDDHEEFVLEAAVGARKPFKRSRYTVSLNR